MARHVPPFPEESAQTADNYSLIKLVPHNHFMPNQETTCSTKSSMVSKIQEQVIPQTSRNILNITVLAVADILNITLYEI